MPKITARIHGRVVEIEEERVKGSMAVKVARVKSLPERPKGRLPLSTGSRDAAKSDSEQAGSNPAPSPTRYDSKWEERYAKQLQMEQAQGVILRWWYHPLSLWLPGKVRYAPDFMVQYPDSDRLQIVEIKGWSKNLRDGMTRLKIAASLYPCFDWYMGRWSKKGGFEFEVAEVAPWIITATHETKPPRDEQC